MEFLYREMRKKAYKELLKDGAISQNSISEISRKMGHLAQTTTALEEIYRPLLDAMDAYRQHKEEHPPEGAQEQEHENAEPASTAPAEEPDPLLVLLRKALRDDIDFMRICESGEDGKLSWRDRTGRKLLQAPVDERDIAVWRRMHKALADIVEKQQQALGNFEQIPDMLRELQETMMVLEAAQEMESVPAENYDQILAIYSELERKFNESEDAREKLQEENDKLKPLADTAKQGQERAEKAEGDLKKLTNERRSERRATARAIRRFRRSAKSKIASAQAGNDKIRAMLEAFESGDGEKIADIIARHQDDRHEQDQVRIRELEREVASEQRKTARKDAELQVVQSRIDEWVGEKDKWRDETEKWKKRAIRDWTTASAFGLIAGITGFAASSALTLAFNEATGINFGNAILYTSLGFGAVGAGIACMVTYEGRFRSTIVPMAVTGFLSACAIAIITGINTAMISGGVDEFERETKNWAQQVEETYCPETGCVFPEKGPAMVDVTAPELKKVDGDWVLEVPEGTSVKTRFKDAPAP